MKKGFQFKQFFVEHDKSTLKVCTESCLFGAWISENNKNAVKVLDIGSGTGLLSLMYAQENPHSEIHALELDESSHLQASENVKNSPWKNRIKTIHANFLDYKQQAKYDLLICNPPFFQNDLPSTNAQKNLAMHSQSLSYPELLKVSDELLSFEGNLWVLLPANQLELFLKNQTSWFTKSIIYIKNYTENEPFRVFLNLSKSNQPKTEFTFTIYESTKNYTTAFIELLKKYYAKL